MPSTERLGHLLAPFEPDALVHHPDSVYAIDREARLIYVNPAWSAFAAANGGEPAISTRWGLGADVFAAIPPPLVAFHRHLFAAAKKTADPLSGPVHHTYECSSGALFRRFEMTLYALTHGGVLVVNARVVERPHDPGERTAFPPSNDYLDAHGMIHMCAHCRRTRNLAHPGRWDWVPAWVERCPPDTSHTLCEPCLAFYYRPRAPESR